MIDREEIRAWIDQKEREIESMKLLAEQQDADYLVQQMRINEAIMEFVRIANEPLLGFIADLKSERHPGDSWIGGV